MQLHLLDATFELFRAYYGQPPAQAPDGREVGAVRGLIRSTVVLLRDPAVTHVAAATDHVIESFRNDLFPGYKTGEGIPPDLWAQFPLAEEALAALGVVVWPMVEFEADDALATAAARFGAAAERTVILSPDKDLAQCVRGSRVVMHDRIRGATYDEDAVRVRYGVPPAAIPDLLALVGDSADGIPGLPGWGMKSAATTLAAHGSIEAIPDDPTQWLVAVRGRDRLAATLAAHRTDALLYKRLATLRTDVPLAETLEDLRWRGTRQAALDALCTRLGFPDLVTRSPR
ncbi:MAG: 5'-3' exonuclease H3TH domain-containing protein [Deltaproteobacteria bacterium]|nr:5'-3' exonuclease H3TH domain-containing protein [Deltaproteobacteria bacterium]